jgi:hypothetical protein
MFSVLRFERMGIKVFLLRFKVSIWRKKKSHAMRVALYLIGLLERKHDTWNGVLKKTKRGRPVKTTSIVCT